MTDSSELGTSHSHDHDADHESVYDGLTGGDDSQWAFGTDFEDPLAGVDTTVPEGVDAAALAAYCLMLGDDALVYSHRLSEWASRAPDLEEDIALSNVALDLLGQARLLLARAAAADPEPGAGAARGLAGAARGRAGVLPRRGGLPQRAPRRARQRRLRGDHRAAAGVLDPPARAAAAPRAEHATPCSPRSRPRASRSSPTTATTPGAGSSRSRRAPRSRGAGC